MVSLLISLVTFQAQDGPLIAPRAPKAVAVTMGHPLRFDLKEVAAPKEDKTWPEDDSGDMIWTIDGQPVRIHPPETPGEVMVDTLAGKDGSVRVHYYTRIDPGSQAGWQIITDHPQKALLAKAYDPSSSYQDAKNYVRWYYKEPGAVVNESPPTIVQVIDGKEHELGYGYELETWWPNRILATIPVDDTERPADYETHDHDFLCMYDHGKAIGIGPFEFLGMIDSRTVACTSEEGDLDWRGSSQVRNGASIYVWRDGKFLSVRQLPRDWEFVKVNSAGDVLVRNRVQGDKDDTTRERVWKMGILRGSTLSPVVFDRPANSEQLLWRSTVGFNEGDEIAFSAFWGDDERYYDLSPRPR